LIGVTFLAERKGFISKGTCVRILDSGKRWDQVHESSAPGSNSSRLDPEPAETNDWVLSRDRIPALKSPRTANALSQGTIPATSREMA
jgi:hypothetical protein